MGNSLEKQIQNKEISIEQKLKGTGVIDYVEFHHHNYFSIKLGVYNNPKVRAIIDECCSETICSIRKQVKFILKVEEQNRDGEYGRRVEIEPTIKEKNHIIYQILEALDESLRKYLAKKEHQKAITYYKKLRQRRTKKWD